MGKIGLHGAPRVSRLLTLLLYTFVRRTPRLFIILQPKTVVDAAAVLAVSCRRFSPSDEVPKPFTHQAYSEGWLYHLFGKKVDTHSLLCTRRLHLTLPLSQSDQP